MNKKLIGLTFVLALSSFSFFFSPQTTQAIGGCPPPSQDFPDECANDPAPTGEQVEELGTIKTVIAGLSSDGRNGVTDRLFLFVFPSNSGQVYQIDYQAIRNDNPSPGIEFCVNSTSAWGQGICYIAQNLDGIQRNSAQYSITSGIYDYTYYSHLVIKLKVRQTFFNDNNVQAQFTMHRREFTGWNEDPEPVDSTINIGEAPAFRWNSEGYAARKVMFTGAGGYYEDLPDDADSWETDVENTPGVKEFNIQFSGPARYGGENAVEKTMFVTVVAPNTCQDPLANNIGGPLPCTYNPPSSPDSTIKVRSNIPTSWTITGPNSFSGSGTTNGAGYTGAPGTYNISASNLSCYSKSITPSASQGVLASGEITFNIDYTGNCPPVYGCTNPAASNYNPSATIDDGSCVIPPATPPTCTSASAQNDTTSLTSGSFYVYAYGVQNATSVTFYTWSDALGQDDMVLYPGTNLGGGTWRGAVNMASHRAGNPDYGAFNSHVYMGNAAYPTTWCGTANFTRTTLDHAPVGVLDTANCSIIGGWAYDSDTSSSEIGIHVYANSPAGSGTFAGNTTTTGLRPDVNATFGITGNHGFNMATPDWLKDNLPHTVYVYALNSNPAGANSHLTNSPMTINCSPSAVTADIKANSSDGPVDINSGAAATLTWTSSNASSCSVSPGGWTGTSNAGQSTGALTTPTTYVLTCNGAGGTVTDSVTVNIGNSSSACTVTASPSTDTNPTFTVTVSNWDGAAHEYDLDCTSDGVNEVVTYLTTNPNNFSNICNYVTQSTFTAHTRNLANQNTATCTTLAGPAAPPFNYTLSNSGNSSVTKISGGDAFTQNTITKTLTAGVSQPVSLALSGVPSGVSASVSNSSCSPTCQSVITFTVGPSAVAGTYAITVTGSPLSKTTTFNLIITAPAISVTCSANPTTALLGQNVTWTGTVSGGSAPYTYSWAGTGFPTSPAPSSNPYVKAYTTTGAKTAQLTVTGASGSGTGMCSAATAQINFNPDFEEF